MKVIQVPTSARRMTLAALVVMSGICSINVAVADAIPGPVLTDHGTGWTDTGIGFTALVNSTLTAFTYQNQGAADDVVLTDQAGDILDSLATPADDPSYSASVNWALTAGDDYFLLQTVVSNELFSFYGEPLPSDTQIAITMSGTFGSSIHNAVTNAALFPADEYWAAFNNITTSSTTVIPEPGSLILLATAFALLLVLARRKLVRS